MSKISDEIRDWCDRNDENRRGGFVTEYSFEDICDLADRIDRELVELPKDAHGEYIRVGDTLDGYGKTIEVVEMRHGRSGWVLISRDGSGYADTFAFAHHHEPTVEDVLFEFARFWSDEELTDIEHLQPQAAQTIAEYAAKLRLAEGVDA